MSQYQLSKSTCPRTKLFACTFHELPLVPVSFHQDFIGTEPNDTPQVQQLLSEDPSSESQEPDPQTDSTFTSTADLEPDPEPQEISDGEDGVESEPMVDATQPLEVVVITLYETKSLLHSG